MITNIELTGFKIHEHSEYEFLPGINAIIGPGGCGKTSIMEAIGWAVFGSLPGKKMDFVPLGSRDKSFGDGSVELSAVVDSKPIEINKCIAGFASLHMNDRTIAEGEMATRETIADLVGYKRLDVLFSGLIGITQGSIDGIFSRSTSERVKVFSKILNIDKYKDFSDWLLGPWHDLCARRDSLDYILYSLKEENKRYDDIVARQAETRSELDEVSLELEKEAIVNSHLKEALRDISGLRSEISGLKGEIDTLAREAGDFDSINRDDYLIDNMKCPSCGGELGDREKSLLREKCDDRILLFYKNDKRIDELTGMIEIDTFAIKSYVDGGTTDAMRLESDVRFGTLINRQSELRGKLDVLASSAESMNEEIELKGAELLGVKSGLAKIDAIRAAARKLPALIAVDMAQTVSELATEFAKLIYPNWSIVWNEDFSINTHVSEMELSFAQLSKSQKSIAALSVVLALAKLVSPVDFILLDEPFANMDADQVTAVAGAIRTTGWFEQVILTTHRAEVEHIFDNVIEVTS